MKRSVRSSCELFRISVVLAGIPPALLTTAVSTHLHVDTLVAAPGVVTLGPRLWTHWPPLRGLALVHVLAGAAIGGQLVAPGAGAGVAARLVAALALARVILLLALVDVLAGAAVLGQCVAPATVTPVMSISTILFWNTSRT